MWRDALLIGRRVSLLALWLRNEMKTILRNLSTSGPRHSWMHSYQIFIGLQDNIDGCHALNYVELCPLPHFCLVNIKAMWTNKLQVLKIVGNCKTCNYCVGFSSQVPRLYIANHICINLARQLNCWDSGRSILKLYITILLFNVTDRMFVQSPSRLFLKGPPLYKYFDWSILQIDIYHKKM